MKIAFVAALLAIVCSACSSPVEGPEQRSAAPLIDSDGDVPTPSGSSPQECPAGEHACSLGATGYDCRDVSWYYCAPEDAGCRAPAPCVPEPVDGGPDAIAAWLAGR